MSSFTRAAQDIVDGVIAKRAAASEVAQKFITELNSKGGDIARINEALRAFAEQCVAVGNFLDQRYSMHSFAVPAVEALKGARGAQPYAEAKPCDFPRRDKIRVRLHLPFIEDSGTAAVVDPKWPLELRGSWGLRVDGPVNDSDPLTSITVPSGETPGERVSLRRWLGDKRDETVRAVLDYGRLRDVRADVSAQPQGPV